MASEIALIFLSDGYFGSTNCMRELLLALYMGKKLIVLREPDAEYGGVTKEQALTDLRVADNTYFRSGSKGDSLGDEVLEWFHDHPAPSERPLGECRVEERRVRRRPNHAEYRAAVEAAWAECNCYTCERWKRQQRGRALCKDLTLKQPVAEQIAEALFGQQPLEWNRVHVYQLVTIRLIAEVIVNEQLQMPVAERGPRALKLPPLRPPNKYHIFCSPANRGADEVLREMAEAHELRFELKRAGETRTLSLRSSALTVTQDGRDLAECRHMLVYLHRSTWQSGVMSERFAMDVEQAIRNGVSLVLAHETPGIDDELRDACSMKLFFENADAAGTCTPEGLIRSGMYTKMPVPLKGGEWRKSSLAFLLEAICAGDTRQGTPLAFAASARRIANALTRKTRKSPSGPIRAISFRSANSTSMLKGGCDTQGLSKGLSFFKKYYTTTTTAATSASAGEHMEAISSVSADGSSDTMRSPRCSSCAGEHMEAISSVSADGSSDTMRSPRWRSCVNSAHLGECAPME